MFGDDHIGIGVRVETWMGALKGRDLIGHRTPFGKPLIQAAVEERDIGVSKIIEKPPEPRGIAPARIVIDDDVRFIADAKAGHGLGKHFFGR